MSGHTKGPWIHVRFGAIHGGPLREYANGSARIQVAAAMGDTQEERDANAALMAAAPDGYEAAKLALAYFSEPGGSTLDAEMKMVAALEAFIAKAEGR